MMSEYNRKKYETLIINSAQLWDYEEYHRIQEKNTTTPSNKIDNNKVLSEADFIKNIISQAMKDD